MNTELMDKDDVAETIQDMRHDVIHAIVDRAIPERAYPEQWNMDLLNEELKTQHAGWPDR